MQRNISAFNFAWISIIIDWRVTNESGEDELSSCNKSKSWYHHQFLMFHMFHNYLAILYEYPYFSLFSKPSFPQGIRIHLYPVEQCQQLNKAKFIFHFSHFWRNENFEVQMTFFLKYIKSANILNGLNLNIDILWRKGWIKSLQNDWPSNSAFMDSTKQNKPIDYTNASTVQNPV